MLSFLTDSCNRSEMAKGHLLITPPVQSKDGSSTPSRPSCCRQLTISHAAILLSGSQLAVMVGYLLHLTTSYDASSYPAQQHRVNILLIIVPIMIGIVMLTVFGIVGKRLWMIVPNVLAQLAFVAALIAAAVHLGEAVNNFQVPEPQAANGTPASKDAQDQLYDLKVYMALSIVGLILSLLSLVVIILCFVQVYKTRNDAGAPKEENGY